MIDFWNNIISSTEIINSATILSLILAVIFFVYQEYKGTKERAKETLRLKEEIVSLIIRNEVNDNTSISNINQLEIILDGFDLLKDTRLGYKTKDILKIAYTRVYENEYTEEHVRKKVLDRLQSYIDEYNDSKLSISEDLYSHKHMTMTTYGVVIMTIVIYTICMLLNIYTQNNENHIIVKFIVFLLTFIFPIASVKYIYDISSKLMLKILRLINALKYIEINKTNNANKETKNKTEDETLINNINKCIGSDEKDYNIATVKFEDIFTGDKKIVNEIMEYRLIIETLIREIYHNKFGKLAPRIYITSLLKDLSKAEVITLDLAEEIQRIYSKASIVLHEGSLNDDIMQEEILLRDMKIIANCTYKVFEKSKK